MWYVFPISHVPPPCLPPLMDVLLYILKDVVLLYYLTVPYVPDTVLRYVVQS